MTMPHDEPDPTDPMELCGVAFDDATDADVASMVDCLAEEYLRLGFSPREVLALFRSPDYPLAHGAWIELGEVEVFARVHAAAASFGAGRGKGGSHA